MTILFIKQVATIAFDVFLAAVVLYVLWKFYSPMWKEKAKKKNEAIDNQYEDIINEYPTIERWNEDLKKLR